VVALLGALLLAGGALAFLLTQKDEVRVPDVVGQQLSSATERLERAGFEVEVRRERNAAPVDTVFRQDPGGENPPRDLTADEGSTVQLYVSTGPGERTVPSVENQPREQAVRRLNEEGFRVDIDEESSTEVREGFATRTVPRAGSTAEIGSRVRLFISSGPQQVEVPEVIGLAQSAAEARIQSEGLTAVVEEEESDQPAGRVIAQSPEAGTSVDEGDTVTITVAKERRKRAVPSVIGLGSAEARSTLSGRGFEVVVREIDAEPEDEGVVVRQTPQAGSERPEGSTVTIFVGVSGSGDTDDGSNPDAEPPPDDGAVEPPGSVPRGTG
jgi:beta-lactam-binding protein with PASTA domain